MLAIGLMSGTSLDGVDASLVEIINDGKKTKYLEKYFIFVPYQEKVKEEILEVSNLTTSNVQKICSLNFELGYIYKDVVEKLLKASSTKIDDITFIAMHGQTIWHNPDQRDGYFSSTLQIGEPSILAYAFNKLIISNFRTMDIAAGGSGAPLVPFVNFILNKSSEQNIALQNIGGIGNVTYIKKNANIDDVIAFDTGPGNMLIDQAMRNLYHKEYDEDGNIALSGKVNEKVLSYLMQDEYIERLLPKSTGREKYNDKFLQTIFDKMKGSPSEDIITTITAYTADTIAYAYHKFCPNVDKIILSGGGARNKYIIKRLKEQMNVEIEVSEKSDSYEAFCFALLGYYTYMHKPSNMKCVTGSKENVILGNFTYPPREEV